MSAEVRGPIMDRRYWPDTPGETLRECLARWDREYNAHAGPKRPVDTATPVVHRLAVPSAQVTDLRPVEQSTGNSQVVGTGSPQDASRTLEREAAPGLSDLPVRRSQNPACDEGTDMANRTAPDPDQLTVADALAFVVAAKSWLEQPDHVEADFDRSGSAVLMLDRAEEALRGLT